MRRHERVFEIQLVIELPQLDIVELSVDACRAEIGGGVHLQHDVSRILGISRKARIAEDLEIRPGALILE